MPTGGNPIDLNYARQLVENFKANKLTKQTLLADDTQAVWFSSDMLLTALGVDPGQVGAGISGLRFYFGAYGNQTGYPANSFDYNKLTLVMVQTGLDSIAINRNGVAETAYLDNITDTTTPPSYPDPAKVVTGKTTFDEGQCYPPPSTQGFGL